MTGAIVGHDDVLKYRKANPFFFLRLLFDKKSEGQTWRLLRFAATGGVI